MKQNKTFYIVADILLLFLIAGLVALIADRDFNARRETRIVLLKIKVRVGPLLRRAFQSPRPRTQITVASQTALRRNGMPDTFLSLDYRVPVGDPAKNSFQAGLFDAGRGAILVETAAGGVIRYDTRSRAVTASADNPLDQPTDLQSIQGRFLLRDKSSRFFLADPAGMTVKPWFLYAGGRAVNGPVCIADANADGTPEIVLADSAMQVVCIDSRNFTPRWSFADAADVVLNPPAALDINGDRASDFVFASQNGVLYGLDGRSGWVLWKQPLQENVRLPALSRDVNDDGQSEIIVASAEGNLFCFNHQGGLLWKIAMPSKIQSLSFARLGGAGTDIVVCLADGGLCAINPVSQLKLWDFKPGRILLPETLSFADLNGDRRQDVLVTDTDAVYAVNGASGVLMGRLPLPARPAGRFLGAGRRFFFLTQDGQMNAASFHGKR